MHEKVKIWIIRCTVFYDGKVTLLKLCDSIYFSVKNSHGTKYACSERGTNKNISFFLKRSTGVRTRKLRK